MNARLISIGSLGVVLVSAAAFYWCRAERTGAPASPDAAAKSDQAAQAEPQLIGGPAGAPTEPGSAPHERAPASDPALEAAQAARETAKAANDAAVVLTPPQQPLGDALATNSGVIAAAVDADHPADPDGFETKYAGLDTVGLQSSLEAVEAVIAWQREGNFDDKSQALPPEAIQALEREQQWLKSRAYP